MSEISTTERVQLLLAQVEILKLKADDYNWSVHTPADTKAKLENILLEIEEMTAQPPITKEQGDNQGE